MSAHTWIRARSLAAAVLVIAVALVVRLAPARAAERVPCAVATGAGCASSMTPQPADGIACLNIVIATLCASGNPQPQSGGVVCDPNFGCGVPSSLATSTLGSTLPNCAGFSVAVVQAGCTSSAAPAPVSAVTGSAAAVASAGGPPPLMTKTCPGSGQVIAVAQTCPVPNASTSDTYLAPAPPQTPVPEPASAVAATIPCYLGSSQTPTQLTAADCFGKGGSLLPSLGAAGPSSAGSSSANPAGSASPAAANATSCYLPDGSSVSMTVADCFGKGGSLLPPLGAPTSSGGGGPTGGSPDNGVTGN